MLIKYTILFFYSEMFGTELNLFYFVEELYFVNVELCVHMSLDDGGCRYDMYI